VKFAFITPRYGADVSSGAEHACRLLAEQLCERHDVDVVTTCARDPLTWKNEYPEGIDRIRGVVIRRFPVTQTHDRAAFEQFTTRLIAGPGGRADEIEWVRRLGPWSPALLEHIKRQHRSYDALVYFSLLHPSTVHGLAIAPERSILFPYLQLRPTLRFGLAAVLLAAAGAIGLFSGTERRLLRDYLRVLPQAAEVVGVGVAAPHQQAYPRHQQDPADAPVVDEDQPRSGQEEEDPAPYLSARGAPFRRRNRLHGSLALYDGRVDSDNGSEELLEYFDSYAASDADTSLVLMGVKMMKVPDEPYIRMPGVIHERDRMMAYEAADITIAPESADLLAQSLLDSFAVGTPVLASARNAAAVEHCRRANAGLYYANRDEFVEATRILMSNAPLRQTLGENGRAYVRQHFQWDTVLARFDKLAARLKTR
jgi:glycosyltransferase involved in cell wall biosynthesis